MRTRGMKTKCWFEHLHVNTVKFACTHWVLFLFLWLLLGFCTPDIIPLQSSETPAHLRSDTVENGGGYPK